MDFLVEYIKMIYFHRALSLWLRNTEILPKQKGVLPFSKVVTFTLKTLEFSRKLSILLQFKTKFRPVTNISGVQLFNENLTFCVKITKMTRFCLTFIITDFHWKITNFTVKCTPVWYLCLKNYSFHEHSLKTWFSKKIIKMNRF